MENYSSFIEVIPACLNYEVGNTVTDEVHNRYNSTTLLDTITTPEHIMIIDAGHMGYSKQIRSKEGQSVFCKQYDSSLYTDNKRADRSRIYLYKEATAYQHLRNNGYKNIPEWSVLFQDTLAMDALLVEQGWHWRAPEHNTDKYIADCLQSLNYLTQIPIPPDNSGIEPSVLSFLKEGWLDIENTTYTNIHQRLEQFKSHLHPDTLTSAIQMINDLPTLKIQSLSLEITEDLTFCHHDIRQSNIAWHPDYGAKLVDWSWSGVGLPNSDATSFLIDLHKAGHDITPYLDYVNSDQTLILLGFWLSHSTWGFQKNDTIRFQQFLSAVSAYEVLNILHE